MDVSIIVPAYNAESTIERCVRSILSQDGCELELIVVNDGSTDQTEHILSRLSQEDGRLHFITQTNRGRSVARNVGMESAIGEWIMFVDADDYLLPHGIASLLEAESTCNQRVCCVLGGYYSPDNMQAPEFGDHVILMDRNDVLKRLIYEDDSIVSTCRSVLSLNTVSERSVWTKLYSRLELQSTHVVFRERVDYGEDTLFNVEYLSSATGQVLFTPVIVYYYDLAASSTTRTFYSHEPETIRNQCYLVSDILGSLSLGNLGVLSEKDVLQYVGRYVTMLLWRAAHYGESIKETSRLLSETLSDSLVQEVWREAGPVNKKIHLIRPVQIWLAKHGRTDLAFGIQWTWTRLRRTVNRILNATSLITRKTLQSHLLHL